MGDGPGPSPPAKSQEGGKRKRKWEDARIQHGSKKHLGNKKKDLGRKDWSKQQADKRARNDAEQAKRRQLNEEDGSDQKPSVLPQAFSPEEIAAEQKRPKRKVAVMMGYAGTGYRGMQINTTERTIEGDLFTAFVKAGAISKANADDPKKSSLVRCARTDKGVHAAGNVISLKLIVEDEDIVQKINNHLPPQIRVWSIERTIGSFSCYQACDSRWYEYLIPTYCFLPPYPHSFLGKNLEEAADEVGDRQAYEERQTEVRQWWEEVEQNHIQPGLDSLDADIKELVMKALYTQDDTDPEAASDEQSEVGEELPTNKSMVDSGTLLSEKDAVGGDKKEPDDTIADANQEANGVQPLPSSDLRSAEATDEDKTGADPLSNRDPRKPALDAAMRKLKTAIVEAKRTYRIPEARLARVREALAIYQGSKNFYNYTVQKTIRDPSARRLIKSFVASDPIIINGTEWLSLKVHGQSFMMHQIRKMVCMVALVVRCGCPIERISESYGDVKLSIPKAPGLGLLLERPVFDNYNTRVTEKHGRENIDFGKYDKEIEAFKQKEIYQRLFDEESKANSFHSFFAHLDNFKDPAFLYLTSKGLDAVRDLKPTETQAKAENLESDSENEASQAPGVEEG